MKILLCHNYYREPGGEDLSFEDEARLLQSRGVEVVRYTLHNDAIAEMGPAKAAVKSIWNRRAQRELCRLVEAERPALMHCTNTFPLLSPSCYAAARAHGVPVIQALRNYRLICANALLYREGAVCEKCVGKKVPWPGFVHACYRDSRLASAAVVAMLGIHRARGSWADGVDLFLTPSRFAKSKFVEGGLPAERIMVKPNFVHPDPGRRPGGGGYAIFAGRLAPEKGLDVLIDAWRSIPGKTRLKIVGDGPLMGRVRRAAYGDSRIEWLGHRPHREVLDLVGRAELLVMPSTVYETFGRTIAEAYSVGTPVVASRRGAMEELVHDRVTGRLFVPGSSEDLAEKLRATLSDPGLLVRMRANARAEYEANYTADENYRMLMQCYGRVTEVARSPSPNTDAPREVDST